MLISLSGVEQIWDKIGVDFRNITENVAFFFLFLSLGRSCEEWNLECDWRNCYL